MMMPLFQLLVILAFAPQAGAAVPIVFIHGIKGAELRNTQGKIAWLSSSQALGFTTADIALETRFDAHGTQPRGDLGATAVLAQIPLIPGIYAVDVYGPFLKRGAKSPRPFEPFFYDWRRDNEESLTQFEQFVEAAAKTSDTGRVSIIAHSMGGLLTFALINKRPELVESAVFAGVPFKGGIGFLPDLHIGSDTGLNSKICSPEVLATFPSVFSLFPLEHDALRDPMGRTVAADFFAAADWQRLKLGPYAAGRQMPEGFDAFFGAALAKARTFRERLVVRPNLAYPPILVINSKAHKTPVAAVLGGIQSMAGLDFTSAPMVPGDGRVAYATSLPPAGIVFAELETKDDHAALLNDAAIAAAALAFPAKPQ